VDVDGDGLTFSISGGNDFGQFAIDPLTGLLSFASAPDAENPLDSDRDNIHSVEVMVSDGNGGTAIQAFDITVRDIDEFDVGLVMDIESDLDQVTTVYLAGSEVGVIAWASDPDTSNNDIVYSLLDDAGGHFVIDNSTGMISLAQPFSEPVRSQVEVVVRATSADGSTSQRSFLIEVIPVSEPVDYVTPSTLDLVITDLLPNDNAQNMDGNIESPVTPDTKEVPSPESLEDLNADVEASDEVTDEVEVDEPVDMLEQSASHSVWFSRIFTGLYENTSDQRVAYRFIDLTPGSVPIDELPRLNTMSVESDYVVPGVVWKMLDAMNVEMSQHQAEVDENSEVVFTGVTLGTVGLTAGYVAWLLRAGILSASLLSFSPLWRQVDPLPVLSANAKKRDKQDDESYTEDDNEKRVSEMFGKNKSARYSRLAG
ncbi:MAG: cadherin repeat domain-containing protein, partial [Candidatus Thiodiazotropha sp. (ex Notomyrtea botanica)]|nr:cadherin repeat domain-containing protein [Candidatus Thiodiazotropha sp. (ex Notomyrtea botanica)]